MAHIADLEQLVDRAQQGERAALESLLRQCQPALTRMARRACPPSHAEDAVQEVLARMASQIGALRVARAFVVWSLRMMARECMRMHARLARFVLGPPELPSDPQASVGSIDVVHGLARLGPEARAILVRRDILGETAPEAAAGLGISVEACKSRLRRARAELRANLRDFG